MATYRLLELEAEQAVLCLSAFVVEWNGQGEIRATLPNILATLTVMTYSNRPSDAEYVLVTISEDDN